jgi:hypothetical protein
MDKTLSIPLWELSLQPVLPPRSPGQALPAVPSCFLGPWGCKSAVLSLVTRSGVIWVPCPPLRILVRTEVFIQEHMVQRDITMRYTFFLRPGDANKIAKTGKPSYHPLPHPPVWTFHSPFISPSFRCWSSLENLTHNPMAQEKHWI